MRLIGLVDTQAVKVIGNCVNQAIIFQNKKGHQ